MADRFPLVANESAGQIQELPAGDNLNLSTNSIVGVGSVTATSFFGDGSSLTGIAATDNINTDSVNVVGVVTATAFDGSGANLTSIPAGQLTGTLPAISGANLTGIGATGTIIQTIKKSLASDFNTTSTSYQDVTGLTQSITLSNANNKVIVIAVLSFVGYGDQDRRPVTALFHTNTSSSNQFTEMYAGEYHTGDSGSYSYGGHTHYVIDTPGSTSRTYKIGFKGLDGSTVLLYGKTGNTDMSYIVLQEISQ